jgi:maltose O-acetyltransferase
MWPFWRGKAATSPPVSGPAHAKNPIARLRAMGVKVGKNCSIYSPNIDPDLPALIEIGDECILSGDVTILAHDVAPAIWLKRSKLARTRILDRCFIGHRSIVLAGVTIGPDSIVGAGSVVTKDVPPRSVAAGNPAKVVSTLDDYLERQKSDTRSTWFDYDLPPQESPERDAALRRGRERLKSMFDEGKFG